MILIFLCYWNYILVFSFEFKFNQLSLLYCYFENSEAETTVSASWEDERTLEVIERKLKMVDGHY